MAETKTFYQDAEPSDQTPGTQWIASNGTWKVRGTNSAWRRVGNVNLDTLGHLDRQGGSMEGAIEGNHGLAPLNAPNFITNALIDNEDLSSKNWVQDQLDALHDAITLQIESATGGSDTSLGLFDYLAIGQGYVAHGGAISMPKYKLGAGNTALNTEIIGMIVSPREVYGRSDAITSFDWSIKCRVDSPTTVYCFFDGWATAAASANYLVICAKSPA